MYMGGEGNVEGKKAVIFICCPGFGALEERARGMKDTLEAAGVEVVGPVEYTADPSQAYGNIEAAYMANPDADALLSVDAFTWVLSNFMDKNNLADEGVVAGGWDMMPDTMKAIKEGDTKFTIGSNPNITAYYALTNLYLYNTKGIPPVSVDTGVTLVDSSNIDQYAEVAEKEVEE